MNQLIVPLEWNDGLTLQNPFSIAHLVGGGLDL